MNEPYELVDTQAYTMPREARVPYEYMAEQYAIMLISNVTIIAFILDGQPVAACALLIASLGMLARAYFTTKSNPFKKIRSHGWTIPIILLSSPIVIVAIADAMIRLDATTLHPWWHSWTWLVACTVIPQLLILELRSMEASHYIVHRFYSPTKIVQDFNVLMLFGSVVMFGIVPMTMAIVEGNRDILFDAYVIGGVLVACSFVNFVIDRYRSHMHSSQFFALRPNQHKPYDWVKGEPFRFSPEFRIYASDWKLNQSNLAYEAKMRRKHEQKFEAERRRKERVLHFENWLREKHPDSPLLKRKDTHQ